MAGKDAATKPKPLALFPAESVDSVRYMQTYDDGSFASLHTADSLAYLRNSPDDSVDLVFCSPPYEDARTQSCSLRGDAWVDWVAEFCVESARVCRGLCVFVVEGRTKNFEWTASPALLMAHLSKLEAIRLRKPPAFSRSGIPGSGGPDWLRNDYEFCVAFSGRRVKKLPWSDNTAMGHPTKYDEGGACTNRKRNGERVSSEGKAYAKPDIANPGNVIHGPVGKGHMGSNYAHLGEAPFPEWLAEFFVRSFCPPGGVVLDPFGGTGTTAAVAVKCGRSAVSIDLRETETAIARRRIEEEVEVGGTIQGSLRWEGRT